MFWVILLTIKCWGHKQSVLYHTESVLNHMFDIFTSFPCCRYSPKLLHVSSIRDCRIPQFVLQIVEPWVRDGWRYQNGWIFGNVPKGGRGHFQSKNLYCRFWTERSKDFPLQNTDVERLGFALTLLLFNVSSYFCIEWSGTFCDTTKRKSWSWCLHIL